MRDMAGWTPLPVPQMQALPGLVFPRTQSVPARHVFAAHSHRWNQFVYAISGTLVVAVEGARHIITPEQAVWLPTGLVHSTGALNGAELRNLYVADMADLRMPGQCSVLSVSPLLRALILERADIAGRDEDADYVRRLDALVIDQLHRQKVQDFHLPWPRSAPLRTVCEALYAAPDDGGTVEQWAGRLGVSARTLARRFDRELGLSLRAWRHRLRLFRAVEWLGAGRAVTEVALDLGYASASAFTYMFRKEMGCPPTEWRRR